MAIVNKSVAYVSRLQIPRELVTSISPQELRRVLGHFPTGVCVVAAL